MSAVLLYPLARKVQLRLPIGARGAIAAGWRGLRTRPPVPTSRLHGPRRTSSLRTFTSPSSFFSSSSGPLTSPSPSPPSPPAGSESPDFVKIVEVGPRDGLQNERLPVPTQIKVELIDRLSASGLSVVEATSFVSPAWVPQMADANAVMGAIHRRAGVSYPVLVPNLKGLDSALRARAEEVAIFSAASEAFCQRNINCSVEESLERFAPVCERALEEGLRVRGYVSTVVGCPYQGDVDPHVVSALATRLLEMGCYEISLGDTIGVATPGSTRKLLEAVLQEAPVEKVSGDTPSRPV